MARIECRACGYDGQGPFEDVPRCPRCRSTDCRAALGIADMPLDFVERIAAARVEALGAGSTDPEEYAAFLAAGHEPMAVETENGALVLDSSGEADEGWHGVECVRCGWYNEGQYAASSVPPCDGPEGKARRLRGRARRRQAIWEKAEAAALRAEREVGTSRETDLADAVRLLAAEAAEGRNLEARPGELARAMKLLSGVDREKVEAVMKEFGISHTTHVLGWPTQRVLTLVDAVLRTVPPERVPAVDEAMRLLSVLRSRR